MGSRKPIHHEFVFDPVEYEMIRTKKKRFIFRLSDIFLTSRMPI